MPAAAFTKPGTGIGTTGPEVLGGQERAMAADGTVERTALRIRSGLAAVAEPAR